ncbi:six-Cys-in-45 modification radical SAM protein [Peptoanaerobacter stomatis]|uniref:Six-Cys-in-45 modification radical SAM protein n=2 Tax=Peptoanaerobacter stomatis TaxID=796937 RepID=V9HTS3_9FIRM|nr:thioether cross-link-forming SCIFF peptide maturase [Peptoanaerobacter stomatis]EHL14815.1 six-Cys-in-45 modification radical SAM protein [Peptoanaerobacter stomatis]
MKIDKLIHKYKMNDLNIVLDINSGSVHIFDDISYDIVEDAYNITSEGLCKKYGYTKDEIEEALEEINALRDDGQLYTDNDYIDNIIVSNHTNVIKAMCLHVAHDCNLRCSYCFASQGDFGGDKEIMSFEVGKKALEYLVENSGNRKNLEVDFFGGEPLMNFEVVKKLVDYGNKIAEEKGKNFRFTITTNGVLLSDDKIDYINKNMHNVVLSLDGRKEINDENRPLINGRGSYDLIVPKFQKLIKNRPKDKYYYVRGTFTRKNLDFSKDVMEYKDLGFALTSIEPVVGEEENIYAIRHKDLPQILEEYENLAKEYADMQANKEDFKLFHFMVDLSQGPCVIKRVRGCGAGGEYLAITPTGDIYPCHQFVGNEKYKMGNLFDKNLELPQDLQTKFKNANVLTKDECKDCWARYYCSGGCHANAINFNDDIQKPYEIGCIMQRKRIECAIMIEAYKVISENVAN